MRREKPKRQKPQGERTRCRGLGRTDPYERRWPCNGVGAKGSGQVVVFLGPTGNRMTSTGTTTKPFWIEKRQVYEAYKAVKSKRGAAGVDGQTLEAFEADLAGNLYKIWNCMSSGSYFPPPVRAVSIPKKTGEGVSEFLCVRLVQSHPPLGDGLYATSDDDSKARRLARGCSLVRLKRRFLRPDLALSGRRAEAVSNPPLAAGPEPRAAAAWRRAWRGPTICHG